MKKKKILVSASTFPRWEGDTEPRFILDYCIGLSKYYDVTALAPAAPGAKTSEILEGVRVVRYHYFPIHKWETLCYPGAIVPRIKEKKIRLLLVPFLFLAQFIQLKKAGRHYDFLHAHWLIPQGIIASFCTLPYLVTGHGGDVGELNKHIFYFLKKRCLQKASGITAVSAHLKKILADKYHCSQVSVIPMGCNTNYFHPSHRQEGLFGCDGKKTVLFVGRLAEKKGVSYLIQAMQYVDARLVIVGSGPLEETLKELTASLSLTKKVVFLGPKNHRELRSIYASADIFAAPSITAKNGDVEGFGLVILEAMASGLPVVASASGGITDIIVHGKNGLLSPEQNIDALALQLNRLLSEKSLYQKLSAASLKTAEQFDYSHVAEKYRKLIEATLSPASHL